MCRLKTNLGEINAPFIFSPVGRPPGPPGESTGTQGEWYSLGISFLPAGERSCLALDFADPRDVVEFWSAVYRSIPKFFRTLFFHFDLNRYLHRCVKMSKKRTKKIGSIRLLFLPMTITFWSDNKGLKKVVMLFLTASKRYYRMLWVFIFCPKEGLFVINFMPFTQGL